MAITKVGEDGGSNYVEAEVALRTIWLLRDYTGGQLSVSS